MDRRRARAAALTIGVVLAALAFHFAWSRLVPSEHGSVRFHRIDPAPSAAPAAAGDASAPAEPERWRYFLTQEEAERLFGFGPDQRLRYDPWVYFRDAGNLDDVFPRPEHPDKRWRWKTNSLGCREDHELDQPPRAWRVLVAGDSHTCGLCNNRESFANLLEAELAGAHAGKTVEVLNAGLGGYSFHSYFGTLLRFSAFAPQVFVVTVFGGNDFAELLYLEWHFAHQPLGSFTAEQNRRREAALAISPDAMGQGFNALDTFRAWPEQVPVVVQAAVDLCTQMQRACEARDCRLILVFLPAPFDFTWRHLPRRGVDARAALEFSEQDLELNRRMAASFLDGVTRAGLRTIDMRPSFERESDPPYWGIDYHLNLRGHALVAAALRSEVEAALADR